MNEMPQDRYNVRERKLENTPLILFLYDSPSRAAAGRDYQSEAAKVGFRVVSAAWHRVQIAPNGVVILEGHETGNSGRTRTVLGEYMRPDVIMHRKLLGGPSEVLMSQLCEAFQPLSSYHPLWKTMGDKWTLECRFREAERLGATIPRPRTWLVGGGANEAGLEAVAATRHLIWKPAAGSLCEGILLSTPTDFSAVANQAARSSWRRYVVQELVDPVPLYRGRRFDLRIFVMVTSFVPLRFKVVREGVVRPAAKVWRPWSPTDPDSVLTGSDYRRRRGLPIKDVGVSALLEELNLNANTFWDRVDRVMEEALNALRPATPIELREIRDRFYFGGVDLIMRAEPGDYSVLFIETNYRPSLTSHFRLQLAHREWLREIDLQVRLRQVGRATSSLCT